MRNAALFTYKANANGYMLYYKDAPIGGAGVRLPRHRPCRGKQKQNNLKAFAHDAQHEMQELVNGRGQTRFLTVMQTIDAQETL